MLLEQTPASLSKESPADNAESSQMAKAKHIRSRGGCNRCRQRRQKCDEEKPACSRCRTNGLDKCTYTMNLQWGGRDFKSYARNSDIQKYETEPGTFVYVASSKQKPFQDRSSSVISDRLSRSLSPLDTAKPMEQLLLHHFANSASRITSCHPRIQIDFCQLLLPMAMSYPPLLSALMTLSAIHRNSLYDIFPSNHQPNDIISLKALSITQFRSKLLLITQQQPLMRDAILATALTLCMCEIHSGGDKPRSWRLHLEGAKAILSSNNPSINTNSSSSTIDPNSQFGLLERWYTSIEALAAITSKGLRAGQMPPLAPSSSPNTNLNYSETEEDVYLDDYFGFSTDLVNTFKEIGAAAWERRSLSNPDSSAHILLSEQDLEIEAQILEQRIKHMIARDTSIPPKFYPGVRENLDEDVVMEFYACNDAYQHSALIHIYRRVMQLPRTDERVQACVRRILECVGSIKPRAGLSPYIVLTMPFFTAGREALGEDRETARIAMRGLGGWLRLRNVWRSLEFLEDGWENGDELQDGDNCDFIPY